MNVIKVEASCDALKFWNAVKVYYQHPNSINRQVLFSEHVCAAELQTSLTLSKCQEFFDNFCFEFLKDRTAENFIRNQEYPELNVVEVNNVEEVFLLPKGMYLLVRKLTPKVNANDDVEFFEFIFLDKIRTVIYFFTKSVPKTSAVSTGKKEQNVFAILKYNFIQLTWSRNGFEISYNKHLCEKGITWLHATFTTKFRKLLLNGDLGKRNSKNSCKLLFRCKVDIVEFYKFYQQMKLKYAKYFVENWVENTDPKKFVYEDIGIATYLLMLWNGGNIPEEGSKKQKFIDLGCGNGLLVHILNSEGHLGIGLDLRKRKIWDVYPPATALKEEVIIPTSETIYPEADWLIGNHSDELTAWIPIMARLSNNNCQYFVLPCCPYQLNGMKFQRKNSSFSSYQDFINYIKQISELCQFETYIDKLRIPSTKRICLIGLHKSEFSEQEYALHKEEIIKFIKHECKSSSSNHEMYKNEKSENQISVNFKVRDSVEPVRNCTKLPVEFIENVLKIIMNELLKGHNICTVIKDGKPFSWNRGRKLAIRELASCLNEKILQQLKNECKGLQTLLKNHHFLFEVSQGFVQYRSPESMLGLCNKFLETQNEGKWKKRKCWFLYNHPDQCPLNDDVCSYSHVEKSTQI